MVAKLFMEKKRIVDNSPNKTVSRLLVVSQEVTKENV